MKPRPNPNRKERWGSDPAEPAAAFAIAAAVGFGLFAHHFIGGVGLVTVGLIALTASFQSQLNAHHGLTNDLDSARAVKIHARELAERNKMGPGERLADEAQRRDRRRVFSVVNTVFLAEVFLGLWLVMRG